MENKSSGIGFTGLLAVAFIVFAPLWIPVALAVVIMVVAGLVAVFAK